MKNSASLLLCENENNMGSSRASVSTDSYGSGESEGMIFVCLKIFRPNEDF